VLILETEHMSDRATPWIGITQTIRQLSARTPARDEAAEEALLYYRRACLAASEERYDVALVFAGKAINLDPQHLPARLLVAQIYDRGLHDVESAIKAYTKVIALSGYEGSNPYCAAAREALDALVRSEPAGFAGQ
jgi:tetratricopeptide (TPR) repeat protein